jgi:hypothetical protein
MIRRRTISAISHLPRLALNLATLYADKGEYNCLDLLPREAANDDYFLVRLKTLLKYLAGPEIGGVNFFSDTAPEEKAEELRSQSEIHYKHTVQEQG